MVLLYLLLSACAPPGVLPPPVSNDPGYVGIGLSAGETYGLLGELGYAAPNNELAATTSVTVHLEHTTARKRTVAAFTNLSLVNLPHRRGFINNVPGLSPGLVGRTRPRGDGAFRWTLEGGIGLGFAWVGVPMAIDVGSKGTLYTAPSMGAMYRELFRVPLGYAHRHPSGGLWHIQLSAGAGWVTEGYFQPDYDHFKDWGRVPYQLSLSGGWVWRLSDPSD